MAATAAMAAMAAMAAVRAVGAAIAVGAVGAAIVMRVAKFKVHRRGLHSATTPYHYPLAAHIG